MAVSNARQSPTTCPDAESLGQYLERTLDSRERARIEAHLLQCVDCRDALAEAAAMAEGEGESNRPTYQWPGKSWIPQRRAAIALATLAAAGVIIAIRMIATTRGVGPSPPRSGPQPDSLVAANEIALGRLPPSEAAAVRETLRTSMLELPATARGLASAGDVLRGGNSTTPRLLDPIGTLVSTVRPEFRWEPVAGAQYQVVVFDGRDRAVAESEWLTEARWVSTVDLPRDATYSWQLGVKRGSAIERIPGLTGPVIRFRVISDADLARIVAAREEASAAPLVLGIVLARAGLLAEADQAFAAASARYPDSDAPVKLSTALREARDAAASR